MEMSDVIVLNTSKLKSAVWNDFDRVKKGDTFVAICRHCKRMLSGSSTSGTSHLRNHLTRCRTKSNLDLETSKKRPNHDIVQMLASRRKKKDGSRALVSVKHDRGCEKDVSLDHVNICYRQAQEKGGIDNVGKCNFDQSRSQFDLPRMIIKHGYPLNMVEHDGFKTFVRNLQPFFELASFHRIEADCMEIYEKEKQKLYDALDKLPGKISIAADFWSSSVDGEYLCLEAHYIDQNWRLNKKILSFMTVNISNTEDMHSDAIMSCLLNWDIDRKLFSMTFDNDATGDNIVFRIRNRLSQNRFLLCNGDFFDVRCAAHVINLMAQDTLEALCGVADKIRESIRYIRSSQATLDKFNEVVQEAGINCEKGLCLDNIFRWDSTYFMLEVAVEYRNAFVLLQGVDPLYTVCPQDTEWERAVTFTGFLKIFVEAINYFVERKYPTANVYFEGICDIHLALTGWCKSCDNHASSLGLKMKLKFDDYWYKCAPALAIAVILDPRYKMKLVEYYYPQIYGDGAQDHINCIFDCIRGLYNDHATCSPLAASFDHDLAWEIDGTGEPSTGCSVSIEDDDINDRLTGFDKFLNDTSQIHNVKSDLDKYLEDPLFPRSSDFNILNWWKVHMPKFPIVSMMARNVLSVPLSKITSESAFRMGRRVLDENWSTLGPATLQSVICAQDWMRNQHDC